MQHGYNVILSKFRKNGVIRNEKIFLNLIPSLTKDGVGLMVYFNFRHEEHIKLGNRAGGQRTGN